MLARGLLPDFSAAAQQQLAAISAPARTDEAGVRDLRELAWASIDNDDSRHLDQLSVAQSLPGDVIRVLVAIADVDALVRRDTPIDAHARSNTTSVYTAAQVFPMLPEKLSTDLSILAAAQERRAIVIEMAIDANGGIAGSDIYPRAWSTAPSLPTTAWLPGSRAAPARRPRWPRSRGSNRICGCRIRPLQRLRAVRHARGALCLESLEARPVFDGELLRGPAARSQQSRQAVDRGFHDRGQRRDRTLPRQPWAGVIAPRPAGAHALGPSRGTGRCLGREPAGAAQCGRAQRLSDAATTGGARAFCRAVARSDQAPGPRRICGGVSAPRPAMRISDSR